jgi:predicted HTH transcriptional regulator
MNNEEMLHSAGFWRRDALTNQEGYILAVALLFGKEQTILNYCPWHRTDAIYRNMSYKRFLNPLPADPDVRYNDRDMVCVNLIESYIRLMNFIERNMPDVFALDERGINRLDLRNMLFREIVSNLLLHREFASSFSSKLLIFSDKVITENWTKPMQVGTVTLDTLEAHTKNPLITKVFREMKWAEELGSGKKNIKKFAPLYYDKCEVEIQNHEKFVFSITYNASIENEALGSQVDKETTPQAILQVTPQETDQAPPQETDQATPQVTDQASDQATIQVIDSHQAAIQETDQVTLQLTDQVIPQVTVQIIPQDTDQVAITPQVIDRFIKQKGPSKRDQAKGIKYKQLIDFCHIPQDMNDMMEYLRHSDRKHFRRNYINPLLEKGLLSMTFPDKPNHQEQKYVTTKKGKKFIQTQTIENNP